MSKMANLEIVLDEMIASGEAMIKAANAIKDIFTNTSDEVCEPVKTAKDEIVKEPVKVEKTYELEDVRGLLAKLVTTGKKDIAKSLLDKFGVNKLSELDPSYFKEVAELAQEQING